MHVNARVLCIPFYLCTHAWCVFMSRDVHAHVCHSVCVCVCVCVCARVCVAYVYIHVHTCACVFAFIFITSYLINV